MPEASRTMKRYYVFLNCNILLPMGYSVRFRRLDQERTDLVSQLKDYGNWVFLKCKKDLFLTMS